jgi:predicted lipid-binding transport protein (Tim44 family)
MSPLAIARALTPVLSQASTAPSANSADTERRPPQAAPEDPSHDLTAPPDPRKIRRALGGFIGGLVGLAAGGVVGGCIGKVCRWLTSDLIRAWQKVIVVDLGTSLGER